MPSIGRDLNRAVTVINRFTLKGDVRKFVEEFERHADFVRRQPDLDSFVTARLEKYPPVILHVSYWRSLHAFLRLVHDEAFLDQAQRLGAMVDTEADQATRAARFLGGESCVARGRPAVVLNEFTVHRDGAEFERRFEALAMALLRRPRFGGTDLLRSTLQPGRYLGLSWWYDLAACRSALASPDYRTGMTRLAELAGATTSVTHRVVYEHALRDRKR